MFRKYFKRLVSRWYKWITGLNEYVYDFGVDYDAIAVDDILDVHNYLMKKMTYVIKCFGLLRSVFLQD